MNERIKKDILAWVNPLPFNVEFEDRELGVYVCCTYKSGSNTFCFPLRNRGKDVYYYDEFEVTSEFFCHMLIDCLHKAIYDEGWHDGYQESQEENY